MMERTNVKDKKYPKTRSCFSLKKAQVMLEFVFCMIILFLMMYAIIMIFRWTGLDLAQRQRAHENLLVSEIDPFYGDCAQWNTNVIPRQCVDRRAAERGPLTQIDPYFYQPTSMNAVWNGT